MTEVPNELTPRHYAALLIVRQVREVRRRIDELEAESDPTDLFASQIRVFLERAAEQLKGAIARLHEPDDGG